MVDCEGSGNCRWARHVASLDKPSHGDKAALPKTGTEIVRWSVLLRWNRPGYAPEVRHCTVKAASGDGAIKAAVLEVFGSANPRGYESLRVASLERHRELPKFNFGGAR